MKIVVGIVLGFFSGFLIYFEAAMLFGGEDGPGSLFVAVTLFGGWALTSYLIIRGARSVSRVFSRGFLIGAAEWLAMIPVGIVFSARIVGESVSEVSGNETGAGVAAVEAGAFLAGGVLTLLTGGVAIAMVVVCLLGFVVSYFLGREMKPE